MVFSLCFPRCVGKVAPSQIVVRFFFLLLFLTSALLRGASFEAVATAGVLEGRMAEAGGTSASVPAALETTGIPNAVATEPQVVSVGVFIQNINDIDIKSSVYMLDFYLWFKWRGPLDPTKTFEFQNLLESWALTKEAIYEEPETLADGSRYQVFHVQGKFNEKFNLQQFPLDDQDLVVAIEESRVTSERIRYVADEKSSGYARRIAIPGWEIAGSVIRGGETDYETDFGHPENLGKERYARLEFRISLLRPRMANLCRLFLPVGIVLLSCFIIFFVSPGYGDARVDTPVAALLTMVALNITVSNELPAAGYIRLIDKVYYLAYIAILVTLVLSIATVRKADAGDHEAGNKIDRWALYCVPAGTFLLMMLLLVFR